MCLKGWRTPLATMPGPTPDWCNPSCKQRNVLLLFLGGKLFSYFESPLLCGHHHNSPSKTQMVVVCLVLQDGMHDEYHIFNVSDVSWINNFAKLWNMTQLSLFNEQSRML